jgi:hypothetical protein
MSKRFLLYLISAVVVLILTGCGGETARNPIEPGGEVPPLLTTLPDGEYLAVGYLNIDRVTASEIGKELLQRFSLVNLMLAPQGINLGKSFHELAIAVAFEGRAYPNFIKALPLIAVLRADIKPDVILSMLKGEETESFELAGQEARRIQIDVPQLGGVLSGAAFVAFPEEGLTVLSTSRDLLEKYFERRSGGGQGIGGSGTATMLARADKRVEGWMVLRHSDESRSLLEMLAPFEDCIISLRADKAFEVLCVMDFASGDQAEESIKYFDFTRRQLARLKENAEKEKGYEKLANDASLNFMLSFEAERSADLAIYTARFDREWIAKFGNFQPPRPAGEQQ